MRLLLTIRKKTNGQKGMASIIVISVLVVVLSLISLGFAKLMDRAVNSSVNSQIGSAADYAARSAINDAVAYLSGKPTASVTKCDDLLKTGGDFSQIAKLSGNDITKYTCVLINPTPNDLLYQHIDPSESQVIKMTTTDHTAPASMMISWQSSDRSKRNLPSGNQLLDETTWGNQNNEPILRISLYAIPPGGSMVSAQSRERTFFLYPQSGATFTQIGSFGTPDGSIQNVACGPKTVPGSFVGTADMDCNTIFINMNAVLSGFTNPASYFYLRVTPLYTQADVRIKATNVAGQAAKFESVQAIIDVTAKSGGSVKRLQARLNTGGANNISPSDNNIPEYALRSASTICKRLIVSGGAVSVDPTSQAYCNMTIPPPPPPPPSANAQNIPNFYGSGKVKFWGKINTFLAPAVYVWQYHRCDAVNPLPFPTNTTNGCNFNARTENWTTTPTFSSPISIPSTNNQLLDFYLDNFTLPQSNACYKYRVLASTDGGTSYYTANKGGGTPVLVPDVNTYTDVNGGQSFCTN